MISVGGQTCATYYNEELGEDLNAEEAAKVGVGQGAEDGTAEVAEVKAIIGRALLGSGSRRRDPRRRRVPPPPTPRPTPPPTYRAQEVREYSCNNKQGSTLKIDASSGKYLTLCEVQATGTFVGV